MSDLCLSIATNNLEILSFFKKFFLMLLSSKPLHVSTKHHFMHRARDLIWIQQNVKLPLDVRMDIIKLRIIEVEVVLDGYIFI
jgi:hypothetical protein